MKIVFFKKQEPWLWELHSSLLFGFTRLGLMANNYFKFEVLLTKESFFSKY